MPKPDSSALSTRARGNTWFEPSRLEPWSRRPGATHMCRLRLPLRYIRTEAPYGISPVGHDGNVRTGIGPAALNGVICVKHQFGRDDTGVRYLPCALSD